MLEWSLCLVSDGAGRLPRSTCPSGESSSNFTVMTVIFVHIQAPASSWCYGWGWMCLPRACSNCALQTEMGFGLSGSPCSATVLGTVVSWLLGRGSKDRWWDTFQEQVVINECNCCIFFRMLSIHFVYGEMSFLENNQQSGRMEELCSPAFIFGCQHLL